ncbi:hypothetical protein ACFL53_03785 [Pseudomonadota bacterium]
MTSILSVTRTGIVKSKVIEALCLSAMAEATQQKGQICPECNGSARATCQIKIISKIITAPAAITPAVVPDFSESFKNRSTAKIYIAFSKINADISAASGKKKIEIHRITATPKKILMPSSKFSHRSIKEPTKARV